jgi:hypothetical protein
MVECEWYPFQTGATLGQKGSEAGIILRDDEHPLGSRSTIERDGHTPFAITCGIYGWMVHTRFFSLEHEANAEYDSMKCALAELLERANESADGGHEVLMNGAGKFVKIYP